MRTRISNPSEEAHGKSMRVYDWIAPAGSDPRALTVAAEVALGVKLRGDTGEANGFINTSLRPDGSLYVCVHLYDTPCSDLSCTGGHGAVRLLVAPDVTSRLAEMKSSIGEHPIHKLRDENAGTLLRSLGFLNCEGEATRGRANSIDGPLHG